MKTTQLACLIVTVAAVGCAPAQDVSTQSWSMEVKVLDDAGVPVTNAQVTIGFSLRTPPDESVKSGRISGLTDTTGLYSATHADTGSISLGLQIEKDGYYPVRVTYDLSGNYSPSKWNLSPTWVLKKIVKPIPMLAKWVHSQPPVNGEPVGYDLTTGDWVSPHGKGESSDIIFLKEYTRKSNTDYDYRLTVSFPSPGDGIQEFSIPQTRFPNDGSALRSPHQAPPGGYNPQVVSENSRQPGRPSKFDYDENKNYFFRVRTVLDENGNVVSAHYGKIYGDFMQFRYYLNPTPNDRNLEFDPKQNLLTGLKHTEQVREP